MKWILSLGWIKETVNHFHLKRCCKESNTEHYSRDVILFVPCMGKKALQTCYVLCGEAPTQNPAESGWMQLLTEKYRIPNTLRHIFRTYRRDALSVRPFIYSWTLLLYLLNGVWDIHTTKQDELVQRDHWKNCWRQVSLVSCNFQASDVACGRAGVQAGRQHYVCVEITSAFLILSHMYLYDANAELVSSLGKISS